MSGKQSVGFDSDGRLRRFLAARSQEVAGLLLVVLFLSFVVQVVARYVFNWPVGWTVELQTVCWLWLILWASALVLRDREEIRFDIVYAGAAPRTRRLFRILSSVALIALYGVSLPAAWDFVTFMKIEKSDYLDIRFDYLFSIYLLFAVASMLRYALIAWRSLTGRHDDDLADPSDGGRSAMS